MSGALRTQIYLTREQRDRLDKRARDEQKSLAQVIRDAIDAFLLSNRTAFDEDAWVAETFGSMPDFEIPSRREMWGRRGAASRRH